MKTLICAVTLLAGSTVQADTLFVDDDAPLGGDGLRWNTAYQLLQDALAAAVAGTEIRVAQGIYKPDQDEAGIVTPGDREATFQLISGVAIVGGYAGIGAANPDTQDVELYEAILSGDLSGDDGPGFSGNGENSFHVVTASGVDSTAVIEGVTIAAGRADTSVVVGDSNCCELHDGVGCDDRSCEALVCEEDPSCCYSDWDSYCARVAIELCTEICIVIRHDAGAGMFCDDGAPTVYVCKFDGNWAIDGAGLYTIHDSPALQQCEFVGNRASFEGGGFRSEQCDPMLVDCTFLTNEAQTGGAGYIREGDATLVRCLVEGNHATFVGGLYSADGSPTLTDCDFVANHAGVSSGGFFNVGDAVLTNCTFVGNTTANQGGGAITSYGDLVVVDCEFRGNAAGTNDTNYGRGGAIASITGRPTIIGSTFVANEASSQGGAIYNGYNSSFPPASSPIVQDCLFLGNTAGAGGAVANDILTEPIYINCFFSGNTAYSGGAAFNRSHSVPTYLSCTFSSNSATNRGGAISNHFDSIVRVANCILWGNDAPDDPQIAMSISPSHPSLMIIDYSDIEGGQSGITVVRPAVLEWGDGNIAENPMLIEADGPDGIPGTDDDNGRLLPGSPCIDAGNNNAIADLANNDLDGNPRFADDPDTDDTGCGVPVVVDMGAYEFQGNPAQVVFADLNGDGIVTFIGDLMILNGCVGSDDPDCCIADLDLDGVVGMSDRILMWGELIEFLPVR